jgi:hypothetical protein
MDWRCCPTRSSSFLLRPCLADGPRRACSSRVLRVLARLHFRSAVFSNFGLAKFRTVRVCRADSPRVPSGQSACSPRTVRYSRCVSGGSVPSFGQSAAQAGRSAARVWTVRDTLPDSPRGLCGQSAPPNRTGRQSLAALPFGSIPPFLLSCFRVCFKESFLRLDVDP